MNLRIKHTFVFLLLALVVSAGVSHATPIGAVTFTDTGMSPGDPDDGVTDGWQFNVLTAFNVTHLGFYDVGGDGFVESHEVGIWTEAGLLLASAVVNPSATLEADLFRYVSIVPVALGVGTYRVGGFRTIADDSRSPVGLFSTAPQIAFLDSAFTEGGGFVFPSVTGGATPGIFGPSFKLEVAVPEPASVTLCLLALGGLVMSRRRCRSTRL
jgi:hypothetical protein